jgi:hypothetical protein
LVLDGLLLAVQELSGFETPETCFSVGRVFATFDLMLQTGIFEHEGSRPPAIEGGRSSVAGTGYGECYTASETHWIDLR